MFEPVQYEGLAAVELRSAGVRTVVVHGVGPRIASFGLDGGDNLLYWDSALVHRRGGWSLRGGHRLWITRPGADESEETYAADDRACRVEVDPAGVTIASPPDAGGLERSMRVAPDGRGLVVEHVLRNCSDLLWSGGAWALTCTRPGGATTYGIPFGPAAAWDVVHVVVPRRWAGHSSRMDDPQVALREHAMIVAPAGVELKRMVRTSPGVIGMSEPASGVSFVKCAELDEGGDYPLHANLAIYVGPGNFMVEMESMSPQRTLRPGQSLVHRERWSLVPLVDWEEPASVAAVVAGIGGGAYARHDAAPRAGGDARRARIGP